MPEGASGAHGSSSASGSKSRPGASPSATQASARKTKARPHRHRSVLRLGHRPAPRRPEQHEADHLHEAEDRQRRRRGERRQRHGARDAVADRTERRHVEQRLQREPLGGEAVQGRQPRDCHRTHEEGPGRPRHPAQQPAEAVELERTDGTLERAGAEEEQRLEDRVVEGVQQRGREREGGPGLLAASAKGQARAQTEDDDADVLDRVERQQALEIVLEERVEDAADRGQRADCEHEQTEPDRRPSEPFHEHPDEAVDRDLDHHAAHQGGHRRRRDRVRARQPDVERDDAGLGAHADERGDRDRRLQTRSGCDCGRVAEASSAASRSTATQVPAPPRWVIARYANTT